MQFSAKNIIPVSTERYFNSDAMKVRETVKFLDAWPVIRKKWKPMMQTEFLVTLQTKKHDLKSRMTSKTVPENAFMILCLPQQSSMKDDWKWALGNANEAEVYNRGGAA